MGQHALRVVFLAGGDSRSTRMSIEAVCTVPGVEPVAILVDTHRDSFGRRVKNLRRNLRKNGWRYLPHRILEAIRIFTDALADRAVLRPGEVEDLLQKAFPGQGRTIRALGARYGFAVREVSDLNGPEAIRALEEYTPDLGIVIGTRILKPPTFSVPRLGCINLHKGKVPEYRGMPPGFWELYDGAAAAGVTVHFIDAQLDTGDIVESGEVPVSPLDTPDSLKEKLHVEGAAALARAVMAIQTGAVHRKPQDSITLKPRTKPKPEQIAALRRKLAHWKEPSAVYVIARNVIYLAIWYSGVYSLTRKLRKNSRAAIILYHRVNDFSRDVLTVDTHSFASHLLVILKHNLTMTSRDLTECLRERRKIPPTAVVIHFDDAYRDVYTNGRAILKAAGVPATAFVSSGYIDTDRQFAHDRAKYGFRYENCRSSDLRAWIADGFEIGAHTVNHADLGVCTLDQATVEIVESRSELEKITGRDVDLFSFPFGRAQNIRAEVKDLIREAGYTALFSAYGGFVGPRTNLWDIPRLGASSAQRPLWLLMEIEGLALGCIARSLKSALGPTAARKGPSSVPAENEAVMGDSS